MTKDKDKYNKASLKIDNIQFLSSDEVDNDKLAKAGVKRNKDLLYIRFVLCHEGINANNDEFLFEELEQNFDTALFKPVNWEHRKHEIIGCIYDSKFITEEDDTSKAKDFKPHIVCDAVVYKYQFPVKAQVMQERYERGDLSFSMETWFESAQCSVCESSFEKQDKYCDHLKDRFSANSTVSRILKNMTFAGAGVVSKPADKDAVGLSVAAKTLRDETVEFIVQDIGNFDDMIAVLNGFIQKVESNDLVDKEKLQQKIKDMFSKFISINDMNDSKGGSIVDKEVKTFTEKEVDAKITDAIENFKTELGKEGKLTASQKQLDGLGQELEDAKADAKTLTDELEKSKSEFKEFKAGLEKDMLSESRMKDLFDAGIKFSESRLESIRKNVRDMSDDTFADYRDSLKELVESSTKSDDADDDANADKKSDDKSDKKDTDKTEDGKADGNLSQASYQIPNVALSQEIQDKRKNLQDALRKAFNPNKEEN